MRILIIEDDTRAAEYMLKGLAQSGHVADHVADGEQGLTMACTQDYDVLVIDRMLPGLDGLSVIEKLRAEGETTPVLVLSALGEVDDRVSGLSVGGDDYLVKPYAFRELLARVDALSRRKTVAQKKTEFHVADLTLDLQTREVRRAGHRISLQPTEFRLLEQLMLHAGHVVTRTMLREKIWDYNFDPQTNIVDMHVSRLRQKVDKGFARPLIQTIRGHGYCLREPD